jgi:SAM-dependent methyltransferase
MPRGDERERVRMAPYQGGGAWSDAAAWNAVYELDLRAGQLTREDPFIAMYELREELDRYSVAPPTDVLVAGCGITLLGDLLCYWGHHVTAIDISAVAIEHCRKRQIRVDEQRLESCAEGTACYWANTYFVCISPDDDLPSGAACGSINDCAAGNICMTTEVLPTCDGTSCCTPFCQLGLGDAQGYEQVGVCISMP